MKKGSANCSLLMLYLCYLKISHTVIDSSYLQESTFHENVIIGFFVESILYITFKFYAECCSFIFPKIFCEMETTAQKGSIFWHQFCFKHRGTVKFVLKFGKAEMAEMVVRGSRYSASRNSLGAVVANLVTVRGWF